MNDPRQMRLAEQAYNVYSDAIGVPYVVFERLSRQQQMAWLQVVQAFQLDKAGTLETIVEHGEVKFEVTDS